MGKPLNNPKVSVLMAAYNVDQYLKEAIDSILNQTLTDFELIVVNDCSSDQTESIISHYSDQRIKTIRNPKNYGFFNSLNIALRRATGKYIAILDGDDYSLPTRLETQVAFLDKNIQYVLCGTARFDLREGVLCREKYPGTKVKDWQFKLSLLFGNFFATHSSLMYRRNVLVNNSISYEDGVSQDYGMIFKLLKYGMLHLIDEPLVVYRHREGSLSRSRSIEGLETAKMLRRTYIESLEISEAEKTLLISAIITKEGEPGFAWQRKIDRTLTCLLKEFSVHEKLDRDAFYDMLRSERLSIFTCKPTILGLAAYTLSPFRDLVALSKIAFSALRFKCKKMLS